MRENQHSRYGAITRMLPPTTGKVFFVCHADNANTAELMNEFPTDRDGVPRVYVTVSGAATDDLAIQAAIDACVSGRNDYVIIMPGGGNKYNCSTKILMNKNNVHLVTLEAIANTGSNPSVGASGQVYIDQSASDDLIYITGRDCEVAGFQACPKQNYSTIEGGSTAHGAHVHHIMMYMYGSGTPIDFLTLYGSIYVTIENNYLTSVTGTVPKAIAVHPSNTGAIVRGNYIIVADGSTATIGIYNGAVKGLTCDNIVAATSSGPAQGTITTALSCGDGICTRNMLGVANTADLAAGGTYSFIQNYGGTNGGELAAP